MMKPCALALMFSTVISAQAPSLDNPATSEAIKAGESNRFRHLISDCTAKAKQGMKVFIPAGTHAAGAFDVTVSLAAGRVAFAAAEAKRMHKALSVEKVPMELRDLTKVFVTAIPQPPRGSGPGFLRLDVASTITQIFLRSKTNPNIVVWPERLEFTPVEWPDSRGSKLSGSSGSATYPLAAVRDMPPGEFDVVLFTHAGERRCKVGRKDRTRLFK